MSYVAAFRCPTGIVMSADTQDTVAEEINYVEKIVSQRAGHYNLAIGGAGMGELVDGFIQHIIEEASKPAIQNLRALIQESLRDYYATDVRLLPGKYKSMAFLIAAHSTVDGKVYLWQTKGARLVEIKNYAVVGYNAPFCKYMLQRLYRPDLPLSQLVLLATYVVAVAKKTATSVGLGTQVVIIRENGVWMEPAEDVEEMEARLRDYEQKMNEIFLACADTSIHVYKLEEMLADFSRATLALHRGHINRTVTLEKMLKANDPYPKHPLGSVVTVMADGRTVFEHNPKELSERLKQFQQVKQMTLSAPHYLRCVNCNAELEYTLANLGKDRGPGAFNCPECSAQLRSPLGKAKQVRKIGTAEWKDIPDTTPLASEKSEPEP